MICFSKQWISNNAVSDCTNRFIYHLHRNGNIWCYITAKLFFFFFVDVIQHVLCYYVPLNPMYQFDRTFPLRFLRLIERTKMGPLEGVA